jgi:hypothetical protein
MQCHLCLLRVTGLDEQDDHISSSIDSIGMRVDRHCLVCYNGGPFHAMLHLALSTRHYVEWKPDLGRNNK